MKKLSLDLDQLVVDSFDTAAKAEEKGTVFGEQCTCYTNCTCPGCPTCDHTQCDQNTCQHTCDFSCWGTCYDPSCYQTCGGGHPECVTITAHQVICMC
jgi:hypothetical protein